MKTLLFIALLTASTFAQDQQNHAYFLPKKVAVEWIFAGETRVWLSVNSYSGGDWVKEGYHPSFTYLRSHYKPLVKKPKDGDWIVTFTSEIAEEPPGIP